MRLATGGTGVLPAGALGADLLDELSHKASKLAQQFLTICIRAVDYCPSVDIRFGEFLRALITADADLVPDDPWAYREALIDAFRRRGILPAGVPNLSEEALRWEPCGEPLRISKLHFGELEFAGDPATAADERELHRQACELGRAMVADDASLAAFGLARPRVGGTGEPRVESIRTLLRRVGPDNQVVFDLVAEVTQRRLVQPESGGDAFPFLGGATIIIGPEGNVRHVIYKRALNEARAAEQQEYMASAEGQRYWSVVNGRQTPIPAPFQLLHAHGLNQRGRASWTF